MCYKEKDEDVQMTEFNRRAELFQLNLDVDVAYPIGFFFALLLVKLSEVTLSSSTKKRKRRKKKLKRIGLVLSGRGMLQSISSLLRRIGLSFRSTSK
jgi:hypothetical protein